MLLRARSVSNVAPIAVPQGRQRVRRQRIGSLVLRLDYRSIENVESVLPDQKELYKVILPRIDGIPGWGMSAVCQKSLPVTSSGRKLVT